MMGLRDRKKHQVRQALVDAAIRLFDERGIDATSVDDIADAVGMSRATFFNHFPYKEAILVEIGARFVADIAAHAASHRRRSVRYALYDLADKQHDLNSDDLRLAIVTNSVRPLICIAPSPRRANATRSGYASLPARAAQTRFLR